MSEYEGKCSPEHGPEHLHKPVAEAEKPDMLGLDEGHIVKFVDHDLSVHAAIIQNVHDKKNGCASLHIIHKNYGAAPRGSVQYHKPEIDPHTGEPDYQPYTWHFNTATQAQKLSIGQIVHFILPDGPSKGEHRPAIIVNVWPEYGGIQLIQLQVFTDGHNDGEKYKSSLFWATSVHYADPSEKEPATWHWPSEG